MCHHHRICVAVIVLTFINAALAQDASTPLARLWALQKETEAADAAFLDAMAKLPDIKAGDLRVKKLNQAFREKQHARFDAALDIAKLEPKSDTGFAALEWLLMTRGAHFCPAGEAAFGLLAKHHADNPKIATGIAALAYTPPTGHDSSYRQAMMLLRAVAEKNPERSARGQAALGLAWHAMAEFRSAEATTNADTDRLAGEAQKALEAVVRDYGDARNLRTWGTRPRIPTLGGEADTDLFELRHLRIGTKAPDIVGEDLGRTPFKLSDYRGKVVLLVFWATWCGPCMAAVPHEKELVERFKARPFVLIGVNADEKRENARKAVEQYAIPWRSFWNGEKGDSGPIATAWNVRGWPTVYVIDSTGVIRHKYLQGKRLDEPLEKLVTETEKMSVKGKQP